MSSPSTPKVIIKRRPSRHDVESDTHWQGHSNPKQAPQAYAQEPHPYDAEDDDVQPRGTVAPAEAHPHHPAEEEEYHPYELAEHLMAIQPPQPQEEAEARAEGDAAYPKGAAAAVPATDALEEEAGAPPPMMKTARPKSGKEAREKKSKAAKKDKKTPSDKKERKSGAATATHSSAAGAQSPASAVATATASKRTRKPIRKVSILNVENVESVPEGVNTPRSVALCQQHGIETRELRPRKLSDFQGPNVAPELAELRYNSYEKRRQTHMSVLLPERQRQHEDEVSLEVAPAPTAAAAAQREEGPRVQHHEGYEPVEGEYAQPVDRRSDLDEETLEMQRQFEEQHNKILEQERRQAAMGSNARRGSTPRRTARSASHSGSSPRGYTSASVARGSPVGLPASAAKIQSRCKVENRELTEGERVAMDEIIERDMYQQEIRERQAMIEDNRKLMLIDERLEKERAAADRIQKINEDRERDAERRYKARVKRDIVAETRRTQMEEERRRKIEDDLAEKEGRIHANDPYSSVLSRRRYSSARADRRNSYARRGSGVQEEPAGAPVADEAPAE